MAKRSKSSKRWLKEHFEDPFVQQAQKEGYRSRAAYKLIEIQKKDQIIKPGMTVVDLGAAPGGWIQVARDLVGSKGKVFALDILEMDPLAGVEIIQGDFTDDSIYEQLLNAVGEDKIGAVISDMAPNLSGMNAVDQPRAMYLAELALDFAIKTLATGGVFITKVFHGEGFDEFVKTTRSHFEKVLTRKPEASRARSREVYLVAKNFKKTCH